MTETNKNGRPSIYTQELADRICNQLSDGISLRTVCLAEDMPSKTTVFTWLRINKDFLDQYARACDERVESQHEDLLELGDEAVNLAQSVSDKAAGAVVQAVKLKADNMKWSMSKMKPKKYGDKVDVTSGGEVIKGNTITFSNFKDEANSKSDI